MIGCYRPQPADLGLRVTDIITSAEPDVRDHALERWCAGRSAPELLAACVAVVAQVFLPG